MTMSVTSNKIKPLILEDLQRLIDQVTASRSEVGTLTAERERLGRFLDVDAEVAELARLRAEKEGILAQAREEASRIISEAHTQTADLRRSLEERQKVLKAQTTALEARGNAFNKLREQLKVYFLNLQAIPPVPDVPGNQAAPSEAVQS
jgi:hypothetical protein